MILSFKDFVNEAMNGPTVTSNATAPAPRAIELFLRSTIQKELWDKVLAPNIGEFRDGWNWRSVVSGIDAQNPRMTKKMHGSCSFAFSRKDFLEPYFDKMMGIAQAINPDYNRRNLITDLNDISDICKASSDDWRRSSSDAVAKAKKRILTGFDDKDIKRITDIVKKAAGNPVRAKTLANTMAKAIDDGAKALRRAKAAESVGEEELASIFYGRVADLKFGEEWRASTTLRDINNKLGIFDDDFDLNDPDK